jgi:uncharacterized protein YecE (DUF72 family)
MLYVGTSGWNYAHWRDKFYPQRIKIFYFNNDFSGFTVENAKQL